jgi:hypothetical protein
MCKWDRERTNNIIQLPAGGFKVHDVFLATVSVAKLANGKTYDGSYLLPQVEW